jgi:hypothetical protein
MSYFQERQRNREEEVKVSVIRLKSGNAVLVISGPGTKDILDTAEWLGIPPEGYVIETLSHQVRLHQLAKERRKK